MEVVKVKDLETLSDILDNDDDYDDVCFDEFQIQNDRIGEDMIVTFGCPYYIESLGLLVIEGTYMAYEDGDYEPDWSLSLVYEWDGKDEFTDADAGSYAYYEQDPPQTSIHNYLHMKNACA